MNQCIAVFIYYKELNVVGEDAQSTEVATTALADHFSEHMS